MSTYPVDIKSTTASGVATHNAIGNNDKNDIDAAKGILIKIAKANVLLNTISKEELKKEPESKEDPKKEEVIKQEGSSEKK